jgi:hypothetical protein
MLNQYWKVNYKTYKCNYPYRNNMKLANQLIIINQIIW